MERRLKERLIGAAVLVMLAVIFIPMILNDSSETEVRIDRTNIPPRPEDDFSSRIVPLDEADLAPLPDIQPQTGDPLQEAVPDMDARESRMDAEETRRPVAAGPPQEEVESSAPVSPPATASKENKTVGATAWVVQLGSFNSEKNARTLNEKLRKAGYPAFIEPLKRDSGIAYRVRVGPELQRSGAQALKAKLKENMEIEGIVIRYP